jgi:hypothetical protein
MNNQRIANVCVRISTVVYVIYQFHPCRDFSARTTGGETVDFADAVWIAIYGSIVLSNFLHTTETQYLSESLYLNAYIQSKLNQNHF